MDKSNRILIDMAYDYLAEGGSSSPSNLQRKLGVGYNQVIKIIETLVEEKKLHIYYPPPIYQVVKKAAICFINYIFGNIYEDISGRQI